ncbi:PucR C-terminal helix-turn-helix domain-containing protein [Allokutzneria albata]|uniref:PucR C-terminal helix-turn-helix domain-containing protein n=1 Tax=Allokutzneria albata TaxID=211114 RepID=A0A1G9RME5_ALLAB|nr:PucR C-terminal helix-turn-helix domain-containing protein [Allokutzneria albata]
MPDKDEGAGARHQHSIPQADLRHGAGIRQLLLTLGDELVEPLVVPRDAEVLDVVILDPDDEPGVQPGDLVLLIGVRGRAAVPLVRSAARRGAVAVAVKIDERDVAAEALRDAAREEGTALLGVRPGARWEQLEALLRAVVSSARVAASAGEGQVLGDLFGLAQTIAELTGGIVSIEDPAYRVLAYSRSDDAVDELRRLSILGREGPESYLSMLRGWGVYQRLRSGEDVVHLDERADLGIRRRLAVGIHAGSQYLGTIWVQHAGRDFSPGAEQALVGAARVAALHLIRQRSESSAMMLDPASGSSAEVRLRANLLRGLLDGRVDPVTVGEQVGTDLRRPSTVVIFAARGAERELRLTELTSLISVHAAAYRRAALVAPSGGRVYVLLPELPESGARETVLALTREIVTAARRRGQVQAAIGAVAAGPQQIAESRRVAERVLAAAVRHPDVEVATLEELRSEVLYSELIDVVAGHPGIRDPRLHGLIAHDAEHGSRFAESLRAYLDAFGDVAGAAAEMHIHPNTLRYRVRRAVELTGIDLDDPRQRLVTTLQLHLSEDPLAGSSIGTDKPD